MTSPCDFHQPLASADPPTAPSLFTPEDNYNYILADDRCQIVATLQLLENFYKKTAIGTF